MSENNLDKGVQELAKPGAEEKVRQILNEPGQQVSGVSNEFTKALAAILPTVAGAIFGGSEGTIVGANVGLQAMDQVGKQQMRQQELAIDADKFRKENLIRAALEDEKIRRIGFEPLTMWQKQQIRQEDERLQIAKGQLGARQAGLDLGERKFGFQQAEQQELSDAQLKTVTAYDQSLAGLNRITELKKGQKTGPFQEFKENALKKIGQNDPKFAQFKSATASELASFINQISGTAASEGEVARLKEVVPTVSDSDDVFSSKLEEFKRRINENKNVFLQAASKYQGKSAAAEPAKSGTKSEKVAALRALLGGNK